MVFELLIFLAQLAVIAIAMIAIGFYLIYKVYGFFFDAGEKIGKKIGQSLVPSSSDDRGLPENWEYQPRGTFVYCLRINNQEHYSDRYSTVEELITAVKSKDYKNLPKFLHGRLSHPMEFIYTKIAPNENSARDLAGRLRKFPNKFSLTEKTPIPNYKSAKPVP